ncbi:MAG: hypothetical protein M3256_10495 [Actinomycetota bacterium]|nr:hypothetical protein [Actinomycetota bacterium]
MALPAGTKAWWDADKSPRHLHRLVLVIAPGAPTEPDPSRSRQRSFRPWSWQGRCRGGGRSARQEYQRRHEWREARIEEKWGRLDGVVKFVSDDPKSTMAWAKGSDGERRLAAHLLGPWGTVPCSCMTGRSGEPAATSTISPSLRRG